MAKEKELSDRAKKERIVVQKEIAARKAVNALATEIQKRKHLQQTVNN